MLFRMLAEGDEHAYREIFHHYNKLLQPFAVKLTRSPLAAEEVLQEVFLRIWVHRRKLAEVDDPRAYIIRIVSNECIDYLQASAKHRHLTEDVPLSLVDNGLSPEQSLTYRQTEERLQRAVEQLPQACRQIYPMSREQYKRIPEIATELQLSHSTVKNQLVKALKSIRLHLGNILPSLIVLFL